MRNALIVLLTIVSGLAYGWLIAKYPIAAQILAGSVGFGFLFIAMIALYDIKKRGQ
jgi:hypothetical protein